MNIKEDYLYTDFEGWPVYRMTLREILESLQFEKMENEGNSYWRIADNNPLLDIRPMVLHDDGMGYGTNEEWITEFCPVFLTDKPVSISVFVDKKNKENGKTC